MIEVDSVRQVLPRVYVSFYEYDGALSKVFPVHSTNSDPIDRALLLILSPVAICTTVYRVGVVALG